MPEICRFRVYTAMEGLSPGDHSGYLPNDVTLVRTFLDPLTFNFIEMRRKAECSTRNQFPPDIRLGDGSQ